MIEIFNKYCISIIGHELPAHEVIIISISLLFVFVFFITISSVFLLRSFKIVRERNLLKFKQEIEQEMADYLFSDHANFKTWLNAHLEFEKKYKRILNRAFLRNAFIEVLINLHKSFSGEYAIKIENLYVELHFYTDSQKKLNTSTWYIKAKGISEISHMKYNPLYEDVYKFINAPHALLRNEVQMALLIFKKGEGLSFLDDYKFIISEWQQVCLMDILLKSEKTVNINPAWLKSKNESVVSLALKIVRGYQILNYTHELLPLLSHANENIVKETIVTLGEIQDISAKELLLTLFYQFNTAQKKEALKALVYLSSDEDIPFFTELLFSADNQIALQAAIAIKKSSSNGPQVLTELMEHNANSERIIRIIKHVLDPLIVRE